MLFSTFQSNAQAQARRRWANLLISAFLCTYSASHSWAQEPESEEYVSGRSSIALIGLSAQPASLESGQSTGVAINYTHLLSPPKERGIQFRLGGLMSYEEVNENSLAWSVHHQILRLGVEQENTWQFAIFQRNSIDRDPTVVERKICELLKFSADFREWCKTPVRSETFAKFLEDRGLNK